MTHSKYRELIVWQKARELARLIYQQTSEFPRSEMFGLTSQMRRAAVSILSNIAEGDGRYSRREGRRFLLISRGSAMELETQIVVATDLQYLPAAAATDLEGRSLEICRMLNGLLRRYPEK